MAKNKVKGKTINVYNKGSNEDNPRKKECMQIQEVLAHLKPNPTLRLWLGDGGGLTCFLDANNSQPQIQVITINFKQRY